MVDSPAQWGALGGVNSPVVEIARRRKMCRDFSSEAIPDEAVMSAIDVGHRAPSAGNTDARRVLLLSGEAETAGYWSTTMSAHRRTNFAWPGLLRAPVLLVLWTNPDAYLQRYAEPDKAATGLGATAGVWPVPYWWVDGGMAAEGILLAAESIGLGACFFGLFEHEAAVASRYGVPEGWRSVGAIALGYPSSDGERLSASAQRGRLNLAEVVHRGQWTAPAISA